MDASNKTKRLLAAKPCPVSDPAAAELPRLKRELALNSKIAEIFLRVPDDEMYGEVLQVILKATGSKHGVFGYIDKQGGLVCPSMTRHAWHECQMANKSIRFARHSWTDAPWCRALRGNRTVCENKPGRVPKGNVPIARSVNVPIAFQRSVIGLLQVASKPSDYTQEDVRLLKGVARHIAPILHARLDRAHTEEMLKESECLFQAIFEQAAVGVAQIETATGRFVRVNRKQCEIAGLSRAEMNATTFMAITHPDDLEQNLDKIEKLTKNEIQEFTMEKRYCRKDGAVVWVRLTVFPMWSGGEKPTYHVAVVEDITERKQAEAELETAARFPSENPFPVLRVGKDGAILYANAAAKPLVNGSDDEVREVPANTWRQWTSAALQSEARHTVEIDYGDSTISFLVVPISGAGYANWYGRDVTGQRRAEQETRKAQSELLEQQRSETARVEAELEKVREELVRKTRLAAVGQVSASIAHDLRNPLGSARNAAYYLKRHVPKDRPELTEFLAIIESEVENADRIIASLLELTRPRPVSKQVVDLRQLVEDAFSRITDGDAVCCWVSTDPVPFRIEADPDQFRQVFVNLAKNSVQAMEGTGELFVEARRRPACDVIVVRDTGPGIAEDVQGRLFEPLVTTRAKGTGLGLTICRLIVERHGGIIELTENGGRGAAFQISLPHGGRPADTQ